MMNPIRPLSKTGSLVQARGALALGVLLALALGGLGACGDPGKRKEEFSLEGNVRVRKDPSAWALPRALTGPGNQAAKADGWYFVASVSGPDIDTPVENEIYFTADEVAGFATSGGFTTTRLKIDNVPVGEDRALTITFEEVSGSAESIQFVGGATGITVSPSSTSEVQVTLLPITNFQRSIVGGKLQFNFSGGPNIAVDQRIASNATIYGVKSTGQVSSWNYGLGGGYAELGVGKGVFFRTDPLANGTTVDIYAEVQIRPDAWNQFGFPDDLIAVVNVVKVFNCWQSYEVVSSQVLGFVNLGELATLSINYDNSSNVFTANGMIAGSSVSPRTFDANAAGIPNLSVPTNCDFKFVDMDLADSPSSLGSGIPAMVGTIDDVYINTTAGAAPVWTLHDNFNGGARLDLAKWTDGETKRLFADGKFSLEQRAVVNYGAAETFSRTNTIPLSTGLNTVEIDATVLSHTATAQKGGRGFARLLGGYQATDGSFYFYGVILEAAGAGFKLFGFAGTCAFDKSYGCGTWTLDPALPGGKNAVFSASAATRTEYPIGMTFDGTHLTLSGNGKSVTITPTKKIATADSQFSQFEVGVDGEFPTPSSVNNDLEIKAEFANLHK